MSYENGIIREPINVEDPYYVMGVAPLVDEDGDDLYDIGYICSNNHGMVNIWSLNKPNVLDSDMELTEYAQYNSASLLIPKFAAADVNYLGVLNEALWKYPKSQATWYRLTDFIGYYHNAQPPIYGITLTPRAGENITIGDKLKFVYTISGINPRSVSFGLDVLKNRYLGVIITGEKGTGTTEGGQKFPWNYNSEFRQVAIAQRPFYNSIVGAYEDYYVEVEVGQNYIIKPGITISCMLCLFDSKNPDLSPVTSMLLPARDPEDIFICDNVFQFKIVG